MPELWFMVISRFWPTYESVELKEIRALHHNLKGLFKGLEEKIMSAFDDLKSAIADLATELADNNAEIEALLTKITAPGTSDADVEAAVQSIRDLITTNKAEVDKAKAAFP